MMYYNKAKLLLVGRQNAICFRFYFITNQIRPAGCWQKKINGDFHLGKNIRIVHHHSTSFNIFQERPKKYLIAPSTSFLILTEDPNPAESSWIRWHESILWPEQNSLPIPGPSVLAQGAWPENCSWERQTFNIQPVEITVSCHLHLLTEFIVKSWIVVVLNTKMDSLVFADWNCICNSSLMF